MTANRKALILEESFVMVPLARDPQRALEEWAVSEQGAVNRVLEPFGLTAAEIRMPTFQRMVYEGEPSATRKPSGSGSDRG